MKNLENFFKGEVETQMINEQFVFGKSYIIRKNQSDPSAAIFYGLGFSLIHLAMMLTWFIVQKGDE